MPNRWLQTLLLAVLILPGLAAAGSRETAESAFREGVRLYEEERYGEALATWRRVLAEGYLSSPLFLNLGNASYKAGEPGWAIYYYEQARRRAPRDPDIATNLALVRREAMGIDATTPKESGLLRVLAALQNRLTIAGAFHGAATLAWLAAGMVLLSWTRLAGRSVRFLRGGAVGLVLFSGLLLGAKGFQSSLAPDGVAVRPIVALSEPLEEASVEFRLPAGSPVDVGRSVAGWREIVVSASVRGWVREEVLALFSSPAPREER